MDHDQIEGNWKQVKGKAKEAWGKLTGDEETELKGKGENVVGNVQEKIGDAKQAVRREIDRDDARRIDEDELL